MAINGDWFCAFYSFSLFLKPTTYYMTSAPHLWPIRIIAFCVQEKIRGKKKPQKIIRDNIEYIQFPSFSEKKGISYQFFDKLIFWRLSSSKMTAEREAVSYKKWKMTRKYLWSIAYVLCREGVERRLLFFIYLHFLHYLGLPQFFW